jgi:hypothetical protein
MFATVHCSNTSQDNSTLKQDQKKPVISDSAVDIIQALSSPSVEKQLSVLRLEGRKAKDGTLQILVQLPWRSTEPDNMAMGSNEKEVRLKSFAFSLKDLQEPLAAPFKVKIPSQGGDPGFDSRNYEKAFLYIEKPRFVLKNAKYEYENPALPRWSTRVSGTCEVNFEVFELDKTRADASIYGSLRVEGTVICERLESFKSQYTKYEPITFNLKFKANGLVVNQ